LDQFEKGKIKTPNFLEGIMSRDDFHKIIRSILPGISVELEADFIKEIAVRIPNSVT
jgi:hypothetical protein